MRKSGRWVFIMILFISIPAYLLIGKNILEKISHQEKYIHCSIENVQSEEKEEWGISAREAFSYLEKEEEKETPLSLVFWREKKDQTIINEEFSRKGVVPVIELCGNSALLFPDEFPLKKEDVQGCLIGENTAWNLFGDTNVIGKVLTYQDKTYYIQGILRKKNIFVCEASKNSDILLNKLTFYGDSYLEKERIKEQLGNEYNLSLKEAPVYWKYIFLRAALFGFFSCIMVVILFLSRKKKFLFQMLIYVSIVFLLAGIVFIFDITFEKLPNRLSDFNYWTELFQNGFEDLKSFL